MKKAIATLFAATLLLAGTQAFAQVSVNAGYLFSSLSYQNAEGDGLNGAYVGATFNIPVAGNFGIAPGIHYSFIAGKRDIIKSSVLSSDLSYAEHDINVPINLNYGFDLSRDTKFIIYAGPTFQYGLSAKYKNVTESSILDLIGIGKVATSIDAYKDMDFNRVNVYLGGGVAFKVSSFLVNVGYDYGMMNQIKGDNAPKARRSNIKIGVGFEF